jgi:hypothetical protein
MIRTTDIASAATQRLTTTVPVWTSETRSGAAWFELGAAEVPIAGDVCQRAKGLSVEQHCERVLMHLLGERDAPA